VEKGGFRPPFSFYGANIEGIKMTASIGVATIKPGETVYELLNRADANFYIAKESGGNGTHG